ncbi:killer toxin resistant protein [Coemansia sp. RSA 1365]|nr:killer toxin resistant protein [Coemansia sp. RSA 1365]
MGTTLRFLGRLAALVAFCGGLSSSAAVPDSPSIRTRLLTSFVAPPLALEVVEGVAAHNSSAFFPLLTKLAESNKLFKQTEADVYEQLLEWIEKDALLEPFALALLKLELSAHVYAPVVVAQYQLYNSTVVPDIKAARGAENFDGSCRIWAQYKDKQACSISALNELLDIEKFYGSTYVEDALVETTELAFDHVYPSESTAASKLVVLYADPRAAEFVEFHNHLKQLAENQEIAYIFRYKPWVADIENTARPLGLSGYGVELALKSTEYKVIDDRDLDVGGNHAAANSGSKFVNQASGDRVAELLFDSETEPVVKGLKGKQLPALGIQATQMIISATDKLSVLRQLSQDLPRYAHLISKIPVNDTLAKDIDSPWRHSRKDEVSINGLAINEDDMDPFHLLEYIRKESSIIHGLESAGLTPKQALGLLLNEDAEDDIDNSNSITFDMRERPLEKRAVMWLNDLEKDNRYSEWSSDVNNLLRITNPGMLQRLRVNVVQVIFTIDLSSPESWIMIFEDIVANIEHGMPVQFGFVPLIDYANPDSHSEANQMAKFTFYLRRSLKKSEWHSLTKGALITYLRSQHTEPIGFIDSMRTAYETYARSHKTRDNEDFLKWSDIVGTKAPWLMERWKGIVEYCSRLDLSPTSVPTGLAFVNGIQLPLTDGYQQQIFREFQIQTWLLSKQLREGEFSVEDNIQDYVYGRLAVGSRNALVYASDEAPLRFLPFGEQSVQGWMDKIYYIGFSGLAADASTSETKKENKEKLISTWVIGDFGSQRVRDIAAGAVLAAKSETRMRVALVHLLERVNSVRKALADVAIDINAEILPELVMKATAIVEYGRLLFSGDTILQQRQRTSRVDMAHQHPTDTETYLKFGDPNSAYLRVQVVLDPLSENAQKWVPILETLLSLPNVSLELWLNPKHKVEVLPVRRFYRYLWPSGLEFDSAGDITDPEVVFSSIPADPLLTLSMDVPTAWLVTAVDSIHDLDNIRLSSLRGQHRDISAIYKLVNILVEGHLIDRNSRSPARGLEVQLGTSLEPAATDTIVMANLGYLQLKANPGVWRFGIRPGRSADIYRIDNVSSNRWNYAAAAEAADNKHDIQHTVLVTGFNGATIFPLVSKRPGREKDDVLQSSEIDSTDSTAPASKSGGSIWGKIRGSIGGGSSGDGNSGVVSSDERPHFDVFAVASGHLYERLMSIMMLSVLNSTESSVKFWLIENFLSPSFKAFVPQMAEEFGFDYEFVTYKWPHWLHHETEKQRTIWGYKILFLDVLFPLNLDRVIFVDADQIVRADLQELADMDLHGAPYGYTPFCDDRPEIDGFRFWKQGWWRDHLRGKPYHISALFVVDLKRFRQMAAGDRMRGQYQALSRDGGSLANLDQDLPNNMQHIVPIHSLPQEWLWCETWCSDGGLKKAKTIDLCNNPMTKEPKLERARRLLPEWEVFDKQVADFSRRLAQHGKHEGAQIADAEAVNIDQPEAAAKAKKHSSNETPADKNIHEEL